MKAPLYSSVLGVFIFVSVVFSSRADLLQGSDARFGPDSLTIDTRTGLTFLDLPLTTNVSYSQLQTDLQPGGLFAGFRLATADEVLGLFNSAGFGEGLSLNSDPGYQEVASLISLVGTTDTARPQQSIGITASVNSTRTMLEPAGMGPTLYNGTPGYETYVSGDWINKLYASGVGGGCWLVEVPEPSEFAFLASGTLLFFLPVIRKGLRHN